MKNGKILKKGFDIKLMGAAKKEITDGHHIKTFAAQPNNYIGISPIPKVTVEIGDNVKAGDVLFFDKKHPEIKHVAPVSGEVIAINRGAKRSIAEIVILADKDIKYRTYQDINLDNVSREDLVAFLLESGAWPLIKQRPFDIIADPKENPKNIFITTFDTAPLAPDLNLVVEGRGEAFQKGIDVLNKLTTGRVHLGLNGKQTPSSVFTNVKGAQKNYFSGPHPAGNVGVQIHHTDPINAQDKVWVLGVQDVITLGALFSEKRFNAQRVVAVTGAELKDPKYIRTYIGANVGELLKDNLSNEHVRIISGDVLSGKEKSKENFLNVYDDQLTVIEEGDKYRMFGWLSVTPPGPSMSSTYPQIFLKNKKYKANSNTNGEKRAFVMTGQYEKVLPMDIYPQHLIKAIMINDFEKMEGLGLYELSEEDIALCEFVCTSKQPLQKILREGLTILREQG